MEFLEDDCTMQKVQPGDDSDFSKSDQSPGKGDQIFAGTEF